jgi:hypothetical protein
VASITTRVTPKARSRSAITNSERVIVECGVTSCSRRPGLLSSGTRTQQTNSALPISNAATRSMISPVSGASSNIDPPSPGNNGCPREPPGETRS